MSWIEFRGPKKIAAFAALAALLSVYLYFLPAEAWLRGDYRRGVLSFPFIVSALWIGGWFVAFFLRSQDPYITLGYDYGRLYRRCGVASALFGLGGMVMLGLRYWTS